MLRRPRPGGGGRHPPPLAPTVSNFKPRAQWTNSGSSIFLYVNLPGFYIDQIKIKMDERTRSVQIQGERPLSTHTKARFNETYRVPDSCDITKLNTSFSHGLLTIEFPAIVEGKKPEKEVKDQRKTVQKPKQEEIRLPDPKGSSLERKKPLDEEKQVGTSQEKPAPYLKDEEPKTYKSVVEGKKALPTGSRDHKSEEKVKEGGETPSLGRKERVKEEKVFEKKEAAQLGQQKAAQKLKEEENRSTPTVGGSLKSKVRAKEEKVTEKKKDFDIGQDKSRKKVKEEDVAGTQLSKLEEKVLTERKKDSDIGQDKSGEKVKDEDVARTQINGGSLGHKVHVNEVKVVERKRNPEKVQKLKEEGTIALGQKKQEEYTKPNVGDEARTTEKNLAAKNREEAELKSKEIVETSAPGVNGNFKSKQEERNEKIARDKVSEGEIQEKIEEAGLAKETGVHVKENAEVAESKKVDSDDVMKEESTQRSEEREKMIEKSLESQVKEGQNKTEMDRSAVEEISQIYDKYSLVNVGVAALVIMGFGAYVFVPLVKLFY